jgi:predicted nucleotidyltransferase
VLRRAPNRCGGARRAVKSPVAVRGGTAPAASVSELRYNAGMDRNQVTSTLTEHEAALKHLGVQSLYLFGSTARGETRSDSDVDLFFDYQEGKFGLFDLMDVQEYTSRILGFAADVMTRDSIHKILRPRIEATALRVF